MPTEPYMTLNMMEAAYLWHFEQLPVAFTVKPEKKGFDRSWFTFDDRDRCESLLETKYDAGFAIHDLHEFAEAYFKLRDMLKDFTQANSPRHARRTS